MSYKTNNYSQNTWNARKHDSWGFNNIGSALALPNTRKVDETPRLAHVQFVNNMYDGFILPLVFIKNSQGELRVDLTSVDKATKYNLPFFQFTEAIAKKYGKPTQIVIIIKQINDNILPALKNWTLYGAQFCKTVTVTHECTDDPFENRWEHSCVIKGADKPVAYIDKIKRVYIVNPTVELSNDAKLKLQKLRDISLKNLKKRDDTLSIDWQINNAKELKLYEFCLSEGLYYKLHKELYKRLMQFNNWENYNKLPITIDPKYKTSIEDLITKHEIINKLYGMSLDNALPETFFKTNYVWVNHPVYKELNKQIAYDTTSIIGGNYFYKSFVARKNLKPTYAVEKLSPDWKITDTEIKKVLANTADYTLCEVTEEQTWISYNINNPYNKTTKQDLVVYKTVMSDTEIDKLRDNIEIEYTSFEDTYSDDYEDSMCPYEDTISKLYSEAEAEEKAEYEKFWED